MVASTAALASTAGAQGPQPPSGPDLPSARADATIQPGDPLGTGTGGFEPLGCSITAVYDGPGATYVGVPAGCVSKGDTVSTPGNPDFGTVVQVNSGVEAALVRVVADSEPAVEAHVAGLPGAPTDPSDPQNTRAGDLVLTPRGAGAITYDDANSVQYLASSDERLSGTPLVHAATGELLGHASRAFACLTVPTPSFACGAPPVQQGGPSAQAVIETFRADGFDVSLRTVPGDDTQKTAGQAASDATSEALDRDGVIQPGDALTVGNGQRICTYNFVFDGSDDVYIGTAAHCVYDGQTVGTEGFPTMGTVVHDGGGVDFALVDVDDELEHRVQAGVKGHPSAPLGVAERADTDRGDLHYVSGYGTGFQGDETTRENRWGLQLAHGSSGYQSVTPFSPGDSGGPVVHAPTGQALGVAGYIQACVGLTVDTGCTVPPVRVGGPTIDASLNVLADHGFDVTLRTTDAGLDIERGVAGPASTVTSTVLDVS
jgi:hypothetical protein